jgi:hypothetical protein
MNREQRKTHEQDSTQRFEPQINAAARVQCRTSDEFSQTLRGDRERALRGDLPVGAEPHARGSRCAGSLIQDYSDQRSHAGADAKGIYTTESVDDERVVGHFGMRNLHLSSQSGRDDRSGVGGEVDRVR